MSILDFLKKKHKAATVPVDELPPLPAKTASFEQAPNASEDVSDVAKAVLEAQKLAPALGEQSIEAQVPSTSEDLPTTPESFDLDAVVLDDLSLADATSSSKSVESSTAIPSPEVSTPAVTTPVDIPVESPQAPSFAIPTDNSDLLPDELFINRPDYIELLGNIQLLKESLISEDKNVIQNPEYADLLKSGIQQSLDAQATLAQVEEHLLF